MTIIVLIAFQKKKKSFNSKKENDVNIIVGLLENKDMHYPYNLPEIWHFLQQYQGNIIN